jgi:hypothetical protein
MASAEPELAIDQAHLAVAPNLLVTGLHCLITSTSDARRNALSWAAADAGWRTTVCSDAAAARDQWERLLAQMAIIDLETDEPGTAAELRELIEFLAQQGGLLLLLCGNEGQAAEEIWARQLGVWLYLPGAAPGSDLTAVCREAHDLVARLEGQRSGKAAARPR